MDFVDRLHGLSEKVAQQSQSIQTEEATKTAFVMPFIHHILGYDVFDPHEVTPEYICDVGTKKGEKIDYAIFKDGQIQILVECKKIGDSLQINHASQLFRYFHVTSARIAVLTNGRFYRFFTDLDAPNKMDEKPFMELDILEIDEHIIPELLKLTKAAFDVDSMVNAAGELKYVSSIKRLLSNMLSQPDDDFIRFVASRVYEGTITQKVREQFAELVRKAAAQFLNDQANERLKSAMTGPAKHLPSMVDADAAQAPQLLVEDSKLVTTEEEIEAFMIVRAILRSRLEASRVVMRDNQSYCAVLLDDNNRKTLCRLHFNRAQKYIGFLDEKRNETRIPIASIDALYQHAQLILDAAERLDAAAEQRLVQADS